MDEEQEEREVYEVETVYRMDDAVPSGRVSRYAGSFTAARALIDTPATLGVPEGARVDRVPTIYRCQLRVPAGRVGALFAILNGVRPQRIALVYGELPLPLGGG